MNFLTEISNWVSTTPEPPKTAIDIRLKDHDSDAQCQNSGFVTQTIRRNLDACTQTSTGSAWMTCPEDGVLMETTFSSDSCDLSTMIETNTYIHGQCISDSQFGSHVTAVWHTYCQPPGI